MPLQLLYQPRVVSRKGLTLPLTSHSNSWLLAGSNLRPYFPAPFGDMMLTGCFGLLGALADLHQDLAGPIQGALTAAAGGGTPPWELGR